MSAVTAMTKTDQAPSAEKWLKAVARPGLASFRAAAALLAGESVLQVVQWAGLALIAQSALNHRLAPTICGAALLLCGGIAAGLVGHAARRRARTGRTRVADGIRRRLLRTLLPDGSRSVTPEPAAAAHALMELPEQVADYHATVLPLRGQAPVVMIVIAAAIAVLHWPAALVLAVSSAIIPLNMRLAGVFAQDGNDRHLSALNRMGAVVLDSFRGLRTLATYGAIADRRNNIAAASEHLRHANVDVLKRAFLSGAVMDTVVTFSVAVDATYIGLTLLHYVQVPHAPRLSLFAGLLILLVVPMFFTPLRRAAAAFHDRERALTAARALSALMPELVVWERAPISAPVVEAPVGIAIEGLTVRTDQHVLLDIDTLHAEPGVWTAITGASGAGKTTLLSVIAGLRQAEGTVAWVRDELAGHDGFQTPPRAGTTAWIGQATVIIDGTLAENIRLGRRDADDAELREAAEAAGLGSVLDRIGLDGQLGDGGFGLSAGQARRVAIARAVLSRSRLWILDEPTAHLDPGTERDVLTHLKAATAGCTVLVATHSRAVVDHCAATWRIEGGYVASTSGTAMLS
ncbi:ATP-binding cassette domain-containing protein [Gryllotalpicola reticulitermitis]|uniref:ATP-binding cassette domain-containing protein n=1 Tax=Gryllotalpicola reticulitermitis TaxID=1184153 RepID=A0ABV8Q2S5_9MICO